MKYLFFVLLISIIACKKKGETPCLAEMNRATEAAFFVKAEGIKKDAEKIAADEANIASDCDAATQDCPKPFTASCIKLRQQLLDACIASKKSDIEKRKQNNLDAKGNNWDWLVSAYLDNQRVCDSLAQINNR